MEPKPPTETSLCSDPPPPPPPAPVFPGGGGVGNQANWNSYVWLLTTYLVGVTRELNGEKAFLRLRHTVAEPLASHAGILRGSSRVPGAGTPDEPLRTSAREATKP